MLYYKTESTAENFLMNCTWGGAKGVVKGIKDYDNKHENNSALKTAERLIEEFFGERFDECVDEYQINDYIWFQLADDLEDFGIKLWD